MFTYLFGMGIAIHSWLLWSRSGIARTVAVRENAVMRSQGCVVVYTVYAFLELCTMMPALNKPLSEGLAWAWLTVLWLRGVVDLVVSC